MRVAGFAKGAAMIGPNMATMLAFVLTDAAVAPPFAQDVLAPRRRPDVQLRPVEGHTSTNDTVFLLANGTGPHLAGDDAQRFDRAVEEVCGDLARAIAADAEGASHLITHRRGGVPLRRRGPHRSPRPSPRAPWSRRRCSGPTRTGAGSCPPPGTPGCRSRRSDLSLWMGDLLLYRDGQPLPFDEATASAYLKDNREVHFRLRLTLGTGRVTFWTCDLTYEYVKLNADYTT